MRELGSLMDMWEPTAPSPGFPFLIDLCCCLRWEKLGSWIDAENSPSFPFLEQLLSNPAMEHLQHSSHVMFGWVKIHMKLSALLFVLCVSVEKIHNLLCAFHVGFAIRLRNVMWHHESFCLFVCVWRLLIFLQKTYYFQYAFCVSFAWLNSELIKSR